MLLEERCTASMADSSFLISVLLVFMADSSSGFLSANVEFNSCSFSASWSIWETKFSFPLGGAAAFCKGKRYVGFVFASGNQGCFEVTYV